MTETTTRPSVIRLRSGRDVLAAIPGLLGYHPRESIVLLSIHPDTRVSTLRVDLPAPQDGRALDGIAALACRMPAPSTTILAAFTAADWEEASATRAALGALATRLDRMGFRIHDTLISTSTGFGTLDDTAPQPTALLGRMPAGLNAPADSIDALAEIPPAPPAERAAFRMALARARGRSLARDVLGPSRAVDLADQALAERESGQESLETLAQLLAVCLDPNERDAALYTAAWGPDSGRRLHEETTREARGIPALDEDVPLNLAGMGTAPRPDGARLERAAQVLTRIASLAAEPHAQAVALTMLAWTRYAAGLSSLAARLLDKAHGLHPRYGLALLLSDLIASSRLPGWAFETPQD